MIKKIDFFLNFYNEESHIFDFTFTSFTSIMKKTNNKFIIKNRKFFYFEIVESRGTKKNRIHYVTLNRDYYF